MYGKLFTVMGILWIFEILHFLLHDDHDEEGLDCLAPLELFFRALHAGKYRGVKRAKVHLLNGLKSKS